MEPSERNASESDIMLEAQFNAPSRDKATKLLMEEPRKLSSGPDPVVVKAVARAQGWFEQLITGKADSMAQIAIRESITDNYVSNLVHLAWLSPHQVDLILDGDPGATKLVKNSMLTRNVDIMWENSPGRVNLPT
jgi:site-specific DNA recombinase